MILAEPPPLLLPADLPARHADYRNGRWTRQEWLALATAALLHAAVVLWLAIDWPTAEPSKGPDLVPVKIVFAPPATPAPAPVPQPPPAFRGTESGKDDRTTAPPAAEKQAAEATKPAPAEPESTVNPTDAAPSEKGIAAPAPPRAKPKSPQAVARLDPRKESDTARAPRLMPKRRALLEPDDQERTGDPYLNHARDLIEQHRVYPRVLGQFGLPVEGTPVYEIVIDRTGRLLGIAVVRSSGVPVLDEAGEKMIRSAMPLPPLPSSYPKNLLSIVITIHLSPERQQ